MDNILNVTFNGNSKVTVALVTGSFKTELLLAQLYARKVVHSSSTQGQVTRIILEAKDYEDNKDLF